MGMDDEESLDDHYLDIHQSSSTIHPNMNTLKRPKEDAFHQAAYKQTLKTIVLTLGWYTSSICLQMYNKWLFSPTMFNFKFPLFTTSIHAIMQLVLSAALLNFVVPSMKPTGAPSLPDYFLKVVPCGAATALDIGLSNLSLKTITLTFYTMVKSAAPVFVLLFAYMFGLEKPSWSMTGVIFLICGGVLVMVTNDTSFSRIGYLEIQAATILSGLRWNLTQILLERKSMGMNNPLATNLFLAPILAVSCFTLFLGFEGFPALAASTPFQSTEGVLQIIVVLGFGGVLAFCMILIEYNLIAATSVVTFSVAGIIKEILTISSAILVFNDVFNKQMLIGLVISLIGIGLYNRFRMKQMEETFRLHGDLVSPSHGSHGRESVDYFELTDEHNLEEIIGLEVEESSSRRTSLSRPRRGSLRDLDRNPTIPNARNGVDKGYTSPSGRVHHVIYEDLVE